MNVALFRVSILTVVVSAATLIHAPAAVAQSAASDRTLILSANLCPTGLACGSYYLLPAYSSSAEAQPTDERAPAELARAVTTAARPSYYAGPSTLPFHAVALSLTVGIQGVGPEISTPLARWAQLRAGGQLLGVTANFTNDGLQGSGQLSLENVYTSVDLYPFRRSSFHISPGVTLHNDTHLTANLLAPGGTNFSLGDADYTSDPSNPIHGQTRFIFGDTVAPRLTVGWGNRLPRSGAHFSFPVEVGFQAISAPVVQLALAGNACDSANECGDINANGGAQNIQDEIKLLDSDLKPLRIYPLFSFGVSYRFGRSYDRLR